MLHFHTKISGAAFDLDPQSKMTTFCLVFCFNPSSMLCPLRLHFYFTFFPILQRVPQPLNPLGLCPFPSPSPPLHQLAGQTKWMVWMTVYREWYAVVGEERLCREGPHLQRLIYCWISFLTAQRNLYINRLYNLQAGGAPLHLPARPLFCYHIACEYCCQTCVLQLPAL